MSTPILPKWRAIRAEQLDHDLRFAPGNQPPLPPHRPERVSRRNMKLELADAEIKRCRWCGTWTEARNKTCEFCVKNGFPTIDDLGETA